MYIVYITSGGSRMWPFTKQEPADSTLSGIQLSDTYSLPVICDAELYDKGITFIVQFGIADNRK